MNSTFIFRFVLATSLTFAWVFTGCNSDNANRPTVNRREKTNRIIAVSYPLAFLTQRIAGESIVVETPASGKNPQRWRPTRDAITQMQSADLIIANGTGATYAQWLATVALPESKICNAATRGLSIRDFIAVDDVTIVHAHGPEGEHSHQTMVARTWLDPGVAMKQATYIAEQLKRVYPELANQFDTNLRGLVADLEDLVTRMSQINSTHPPTLILASPKLKYFARATGVDDQHLVSMSVAMSEGQATPAATELAIAELDSLLSEEEFASSPPRLILFGNRIPNGDLHAMLEDRNLIAVPIDLIDSQPETGDYLSAMGENIEKLSGAVSAAAKRKPSPPKSE